MADQHHHEPPGDIFEARSLWASLLAMGRATVALKTARDELIVSTGNSLAGASVQILFQSALGLVNELGQQFATLGQTSEDPAVRSSVATVLAHLHAPEPVSEPDSQRVTVPSTDPTSEPPSS